MIAEIERLAAEAQRLARRAQIIAWISGALAVTSVLIRLVAT